ncbi:hypothetical protein VPH35_102180 [Triticum aestivum]
MDCLINTPEDMRILQLRGILVNQINGEQDASRFFSRICARYAVGYWPDNNYLKDVTDKVNNYRGSRLHKWRAALVRSYFSNPWVAMSVLAAVLLLGMTILQTTFTVYPYFSGSALQSKNLKQEAATSTMSMGSGQLLVLSFHQQHPTGHGRISFLVTVIICACTRQGCPVMCSSAGCVYVYEYDSVKNKKFEGCV